MAAASEPGCAPVERALRRRPRLWTTGIELVTYIRSDALNSSYDEITVLAAAIALVYTSSCGFALSTLRGN